ncbi:UPF0758 protein YicR [Salmonella enterica subsp. enterica serovar Choleraesuis]|nr:UPF0758 protein YicR [Salmonella enterica subsp. enterica serovar Choleraesuis]
MKKYQGVLNGPREKLMKYGSGSLTDEELLALFLRTGVCGTPVLSLARQLIHQFGSLHQLLKADFSRFDSVKGIGIAKYAQLNAIAELARRFYSSQVAEEKPLLTPLMVKEFLSSQLCGEEREIFVVIFMDNQHRVIHHVRMFSGTVDRVEVHPREIVREAMKVNAVAVILAHNHPSGYAEPSQADRLMTKRIVESCQMLDIRVLDHVVIGRGSSVSFAERGLI